MPAIKRKRSAWRELSKKLHNAGDAARTATRRADGTSCSIPVL